MKILALDLGNKLGVARPDEDGEPMMRTFTLADPKEITQWRKDGLDRTGDPRFGRLYELLDNQDDPDLVVFEDVQFSKTTQQTQLWATWRAAIWSCFPSEIVRAVPVTALKKFATGKGNADKLKMAEAMAKAEPRRFQLGVALKKGQYLRDIRSGITGRGDHLLDDNAVDSYWLYRWGEKHS